MTSAADSRLEEVLGDIRRLLESHHGHDLILAARVADAEDRIAILAGIVGREDLTRPNPDRLAEAEEKLRQAAAFNLREAMKR